MAQWRGNAESTGVTLLDILDKVLDKGLVIAGDISVSLADVELLTIRIRLLVCSIDKATEIGLDWWRRDSFFSAGAGEAEDTAALRARVEALERRLSATSEATGEQSRPPESRRQPESGGSYRG